MRLHWISALLAASWLFPFASGPSPAIMPWLACLFTIGASVALFYQYVRWSHPSDADQEAPPVTRSARKSDPILMHPQTLKTDEEMFKIANMALKLTTIDQ